MTHYESQEVELQDNKSILCCDQEKIVDEEKTEDEEETEVPISMQSAKRHSINVCT